MDVDRVERTAVFIWLSSLWADSIRPNFRHEREPERIVRRKLEPQLHRVVSLVGEIVIFTLIALGARVILRVRLVSRNQRS